jgi:formate/nitrite transporter FocA (FNT family)
MAKQQISGNSHGSKENEELKVAEEAEERKMPPAHIVFETIRLEGEHELARTPLALSFSGFGAGLSMGFSFILMALLRAYLPHASWTPLVESFGYTSGFLIVVMGRQQLFTENTLTPILPLLSKPKLDTARRVLRLWIIVLIANVIGCACVAYVLAHAPVFAAPVHAALNSLATEKFSRSFVEVFWGAIFGGWLIALMVWLIPASEGAAIPGLIVLLTYTVSLGHFSHIIAGSVEALYAVFAGLASGVDFLIRFFVPTLIGNIIGGVLLVSFLGFAQVQPDISRQ